MADPDRPPTLLSLLALVLPAWRLVLALPLVAATLAVALGVVQPRQFRVRAAFIPEAGDPAAGRLPGLAAQLGFSLNTQEPGESPEFYVALITSREVLEPVVTAMYADSAGRPLDLPEILDVRAQAPERRRVRAVLALSGRTSARVLRQPGMVEVAVELPDPDLAHAVVQGILDEVSRFNVARRQTRAGQERRFIEGRLTAVGADLQAAEARLASFVRSNRMWQQDPDLQVEYDRLNRQLLLHQDVFSALSQSVEQARMDEVRSTPVITVVEPPRRPAFPTGRRLVQRALLGLVLGGLLALGIAWTRAVIRAAPETDPRAWKALRDAMGRRAAPLD